MAYTSKYAQERLAKYGKRHVEKGEDPSGGKWKSVETKKKLKEKYKGADGYKSKKVTDRNTGDTKTKTVIKSKIGPKTSDKEVIKTKNGKGTYKYISKEDPKVAKYRGGDKKRVEKGIVDTDSDGRRDVYITSSKSKTAGNAARKAARKIGRMSQKTVNPNK